MNRGETRWRRPHNQHVMDLLAASATSTPPGIPADSPAGSSTVHIIGRRGPRSRGDVCRDRDPSDLSESRDLDPCEAFGAEEIRALREGLRRAVLTMDQFRGQMAAELGVGVHELTALGHILASPGITPTQLSGRLGISGGSTTGVVDRLAAAGLVRRAPHPTDHRSVQLCPTAAGSAARGRAESVLDAALTQAVRSFPAGTGQGLADQLEQISSAVTITTTGM